MTLRTDKVESVILRRAAVLLHDNVSFSDTTITITRVQVSPDLKHALLWVSIFGRQTEAAASAVLAMQPSLSRLVARVSTTKFSPKLKFEFDTSAEYADKINRLIKKVD